MLAFPSPTTGALGVTQAGVVPPGIWPLDPLALGCSNLGARTRRGVRVAGGLHSQRHHGGPARPHLSRICTVVAGVRAGHRGGTDLRDRDRFILDGPARSRREAPALRPPWDPALLDRGSGSADHRGARLDRGCFFGSPCALAGPIVGRFLRSRLDDRAIDPLGLMVDTRALQSVRRAPDPPSRVRVVRTTLA